MISQIEKCIYEILIRNLHSFDDINLNILPLENLLTY